MRDGGWGEKEQARGPASICTLTLARSQVNCKIKNDFDLNVGFRKKWMGFFLAALASSWP